MRELTLVSTDGQATVLGSITLDPDGVATHTGAGVGLFVALRRKMPHGTDADAFAILARGWTNGYATLLAEGTPPA